LRAYSAPWSSYLDLRGPTSKKKEGKRRENVGKRKGLERRKGVKEGEVERRGIGGSRIF